MGFTVKIGEKCREVGFATMCSLQGGQGGINGGSALGIDDFSRRVEKGQQPGSRRLHADQRNIDTHLAGTGHALGEMFAAFDDLRAEELAPGPAVESDDELDHYIRTSAEADYHSVGTARMGSDTMAVVDANLRVHGVDGLRVVDASIMPCMIGGSTNMPTIMIAEKAADMILGLPALARAEFGA